MRISDNVLNKCNTLEDLVEIMVTDKDGNRLNYSEIGETKSFVHRFNQFKDVLKRMYPALTFKEILFLMDNQDTVRYVSSWYGYDRLLTALEFEQRKNEIR